MSIWSTGAAGFLATTFTLSVCAAEGGQSATTNPPAYPATYFTQFQPLSALDMVRHLPGFTIRTGDTDLRGYSGAAGNILIDGQRPAGKEEGIEDLLARIPAANVSHIELISSGSAAFDMQDYILLANVVRKRDTRVSGQIKMGNTAHEFGDHTPRLSGEVSLNTGNQVLDLSGALYQEFDDQKGSGTRNRFDRNGQPLRLANYSEPEISNTKEVAAKYRREMWGGTLRLNGATKDGREETDVTYAATFPAPVLATTSETDKSRLLELDINYERSPGPGRKLELLALHRFANMSASERSAEGENTAFATEKARATETILRGAYRQKLGSVTLEGGIETAWNVLDSRSTLEENGTTIELPASSVKVTEQRTEFFASSVFRLSSSINLDAGVRYERSTLNQTGDSQSRRHFNFIKPRLLLSWAPGRNGEVRFLAEREVGQLDFEDFVSSSSLSEETITAGNRELRPERLWRLGLEWQKQFHHASLVLSYRYEVISDVIDHIPLAAGAAVFDAIGNIRSAARHELEMNLNVPMAAIGLRNLTLQADTIWRSSSVKDPLTDARRRISGDVPLEGRIQVTYDLPLAHVRFGSMYTLVEKETSFELEEVKTDWEAERLNLFVEYKPSSHWAIRAYANNLTNGPAETRRNVYAGPRNTSTTDYLDIKSLKGGRSFGVSLEWLFP